jgi:hypothetical protein
MQEYNLPDLNYAGEIYREFFLHLRFLPEIVRTEYIIRMKQQWTTEEYAGILNILYESGHVRTKT